MKNWKTTAEAILTSGPVVPVIVVKKLEHAVPMAKALVAGGVRVLEVTLRTECALEAIRAIAKEVPDAIVGAGTVTNVEQLKAVTEAGAQFAISPGLTESLLKAATEDGTIPLIPGISTVSELMLGMQYGLKEFKFFPAEANGGVKALQAIAGPFGHIRFCPTGGISPANYRDYLALNSVLCIGGSWLVPADAWKPATTIASPPWRVKRWKARSKPRLKVNNPVSGNATGFFVFTLDDDRRGGGFSPRHGLFTESATARVTPGDGYRQSPACRTDAAAGQPRRPTAAGQS
jgi:2-dehydro-3-deoxyphosphogluconate aldolase/(4S)-4-hydroxy-2-oxoglutarate aldolase